MLQRAASNAYSWWWASHIRTKQGKWLSQNLQDMEEKVKSILSVIEDDADSFAKRAEMYYKKRPELINYIEEYYKAYRSLAERYMHITRELHNAHETISNAFPDQVQFSLEDDDNEHLQNASLVDSSDIPIGLPKNLKSNQKLSIQNGRNKPSLRKIFQASSACPEKNKAEMLEEREKLQKKMFVLQMEMESLKGSYESGVAKYWEIEKQITGMQEQVLNLQDEFSVGIDIVDNEARSLVAATALRSCEGTLVQLREQQISSMEKEMVEFQRMKDVENKLRALKHELLNLVEDQYGPSKDIVEDSTTRNPEEELYSLKQERLDWQSICERVKEYFEMDYNTPLTATELAEKIDELVNMVLGLGPMVSSQIALIRCMQLEIYRLESHLQRLEQEKMTLTYDSSGLNEKIRELENELQGVQDLHRSIKDESSRFQMSFADVYHSLEDLSGEIKSPKRQDAVEIMDMEDDVFLHVGTPDLPQGEEAMMDSKDEMAELEEGNKGTIDDDLGVEDRENHDQAESCHNLSAISKHIPSLGLDDILFEVEDTPKWQELVPNGLENREKFLLAEYTSILRNYEETKQRLMEIENFGEETLFQTVTHIRELKSASVVKDMEIFSLRQKLSILQQNQYEDTDNYLIKVEDIISTRNGSMEDISKSKPENFCEKNLGESNSDSSENVDILNALSFTETPTEEEIKICITSENNSSPSIEDKFRQIIDELLEENLQFWLRFSTSFNKIYNFEVAIQDLEAKVLKMSANTSDLSIKLETTLIIKQLKELKTELSEWLEENSLLKDELQCRFSSLCEVQKEILSVPKMCYQIEEANFTTYDAAKFQGEILNMLQENNGVENELQVGLDRVRGLQREVEKILLKLRLIAVKKHQHVHHSSNSTNWSEVPLRSFIFGVKPKKASKFSLMSPELKKQLRELKAGLPK